MLILDNNGSYNADELKELLSSVTWGSHLTKDKLYEAMQNSSHIVTARKDGVLVGIARSMDDDIWSANIDCIVVHADHQGQGIGTALLQALLKDISHIQFISAMPNSHKNVLLYTRNGFTLIDDSRLLQIENTGEKANSHE